MADDYPRAVVREINGQLVLDDPDALAVMRAVEKHNCKQTFALQLDRVAHFAKRMAERGATPEDMVIVLLNVDDPNGGRLANILMPNMDWQPMRDRGEVPFARGLAMREGIEELVEGLDQEAGEKLSKMRTRPAVVVMDHGVIEIFEAPDALKFEAP